MTVKAILSRKGNDVVTIKPTATLCDAVRTLDKHRIGAVVITDADQQILGILSERDIVRTLAHNVRVAGSCQLCDEPVEKVMTGGRRVLIAALVAAKALLYVRFAESSRRYVLTQRIRLEHHFGKSVFNDIADGNDSGKPAILDDGKMSALSLRHPLHKLMDRITLFAGRQPIRWLLRVLEASRHFPQWLL